MKDFDKKEIDEFFRSGLISPEISEIDEDWDRMKAILQKDKNNKVLKSALLRVSAIAAILLIVFFIIPDSQVLPEKEQSSATVRSPGPGNNFIKEPEITETSSGIPEKYATKINDRADHPALISEHETVVTGKELAEESQSLILSSAISRPVADHLSSSSIQQDTSQVIIASDTGIGEINTETEESKNELDPETELLKSRGSAGRFSVSLAISQDFSGVNDLRDSRIGYGIGAGISYKVSDNLSVESVVAYGKKIYGTSFSNYRPDSRYVFPVNPSQVNANCDVLDLQFNLNYKLLDRERFSFGVGAGLSSYLMLEEYYAFRYESSSSRGPRRYDMENQNKHYLGVANLSVFYHRKLANNINLAFNPYLKLPLTDIGYGNVRLKSAGINIGIVTNLNNQSK